MTVCIIPGIMQFTILFSARRCTKELVVIVFIYK